MRKAPFIFFLFIGLIFLVVNRMNGQADSLILMNEDVIVGEMKGMDRGIVKVETDYSKEDFQIEWKGVREVYTESYYFVTVNNGSRFSGKLRSTGPGKVNIISEDNTAYEFDLISLVMLKSIDRVFWDRFSATIDFGFSLTKSNKLRQVNLSSKVGYMSENWSTDVYYNSLFSTQDDIEDISRIEAGGSFSYFLPKDWYIPISISFLSSTEQKIDLRTLGKIGAGKYIIHTNHSYWGAELGFTFNNEQFYDGDPRKSLEGYVGSELNLYDIGDLNLLTRIAAYPSLTESGRWRVDYVFDAKYDLPLDFYIKFGVTVNYDNQPVEGASKTDYILKSGFGWEW